MQHALCASFLSKQDHTLFYNFLCEKMPNQFEISYRDDFSKLERYEGNERTLYSN